MTSIGIIRAATILDLQAITDIYNEAILNTTATFDIEPKTLESRKRWLTERSPRHPIIVYDQGGSVKAWASLSLWSDKLGYADAVENSLYVSPEMQGQGIGHQLMKHLISLAQEHKIHTILARIADGNQTSIRLHRTHGFELAGVLKETGFKFGRRIDVHMYQLILK